jgi:hypothetical protein
MTFSMMRLGKGEVAGDGKAAPAVEAEVEVFLLLQLLHFVLDAKRGPGIMACHWLCALLTL